MEDVNIYFESMPTYFKLIWIVLCLSSALLVESLIPLFKVGYRSRQHMATNLTFLLIVVVCNLIIGIFTVGLYDWLSTNDWGILNQFDVTLFTKLIISILLLDFISQYCAHWSLHNIKPLWRLHLVHHSDTNVDTTTGLRLHPFDYLVRESFAILGVFILDAPLAFYLIFRFIHIDNFIFICSSVTS